MSRLSTFLGIGSGSGGMQPFYNDPLNLTDYVVGNYYPPSVDFSYGRTQIITSDTLIFCPFVPRATHTFTGMAIKNSGTDTGDSFRLGIYESDTSYKPSDKLLETSEYTLVADSEFVEFTVSQELIKDTLYWLAFWCDASATFIVMAGSSGNSISEVPVMPSLGYYTEQLQSSSLPQNPLPAYLGGTYGIMPDPVTIDSAYTYCPIITLKA